MKTINLDGRDISFAEGQTVMDCALAAQLPMPHLCHLPGLKPHGSCRLCTVKIDGRFASACTQPAGEGMRVESDTEELHEIRLGILRMLFVEGNHYCPSCEKSGSCKLQHAAYNEGMLDLHYPPFYPKREMDASHPDILIDRDRCIFCELCVRASRDIDGKDIFGIAGRGRDVRLVINSSSGLLADTDISVKDRAVQVCPVGAILVKGRGFEVPIGERTYD